MSVGAPASLRLYGAASAALSPLAGAWLRDRARRGKEDPVRWRERLGQASRPRPPGRLAWLHGASVGEALSLLPLAQRLTADRPDASVLVTSGTLAAASLLADRLPAGAIHQFAPLDAPAAARSFLDHWRPDLAVFAESELWPNLILGARARGARLALVSARLSPASARGWARAPAAARAVLGAFDLVLARDQQAAATLAALGARVDGLADLKVGASPLPADERDLARLRSALGDRAVLLGASTHPGEDALILDAFAAARDAAPSLLILAPRHPGRGAAVAAEALGAGLTARRRSAGADPGDEAVYVADTLGDMGLWYRLAVLAVVGGSLLPGGAGGHNPLEPARLRCPFVAGPFTPAWPVYDALEAAGATRRLAGEGLSSVFAQALAGDPALPAMAAAALAFVLEADAAAKLGVQQVAGLLAP